MVSAELKPHDCVFSLMITDAIQVVATLIGIQQLPA
jgi:hypothetical protein